MLHPEPVHLARELLAELLEQILTEQLVLQRAQYARFDVVTTNAQVVVASSVVACAEASKAVFARHDESCAAHTAFRQTREQILRPLCRTDGARCFQSMPCVLLA